jgi:hypothetical protein
MTNLDLLCMETAQAMVTGRGTAKEKEGLAAKALGVLMENGPYAMALFLDVKKGDPPAVDYQNQLVNLFRNSALQAFVAMPPVNSRATDWLRIVAQDLDAYLFVKRIWQQTLTYARYHAKSAD